MNRLELCRRVILESGVSNVTLGTTLNQYGEAANFVNWVDDAWEEVQSLLNWPSLWERAALTVPSGASSVAGGLAEWRYDLTEGVTRIGDAPLVFLPYSDFKVMYRTVSPGVPSAWTIQPDRSVALNAVVEAETAVTVERFRLPGRFSQDDDVPALPSEHHMMIAWRALMLYGGFDESGAAFQRGQSEYRKAKKRAFSEFGPMTPGEPLA